jgi:hypothetical protein
VSSSGRPDQPTITPTSLKLFKWMVSYGQLMCVLGPASPQVFKVRSALLLNTFGSHCDRIKKKYQFFPYFIFVERFYLIKNVVIV